MNSTQFPQIRLPTHKELISVVYRCTFLCTDISTEGVANPIPNDYLTNQANVYCQDQNRISVKEDTTQININFQPDGPSCRAFKTGMNIAFQCAKYVDVLKYCCWID